MCVCVHDDLETIADICFLLGSYVDWRNILDEFACQGHRSVSRSFGKGMSYFFTGSEISSQMSSFLSASLYFSKRGSY